MPAKNIYLTVISISNEGIRQINLIHDSVRKKNSNFFFLNGKLLNCKLGVEKYFLQRINCEKFCD